MPNENDKMNQDLSKTMQTNIKDSALPNAISNTANRYQEVNNSLRQSNVRRANNSMNNVISQVGGSTGATSNNSNTNTNTTPNNNALTDYQEALESMKDSASNRLEELREELKHNNYVELINSNIATEIAKQNALKYTQNQIKSAGYGSTGYGSTQYSDTINAYLNALGTNRGNYQNANNQVDMSIDQEQFNTEQNYNDAYLNYLKEQEDINGQYEDTFISQVIGDLQASANSSDRQEVLINAGYMNADGTYTDKFNSLPQQIRDYITYTYNGLEGTTSSQAITNYLASIGGGTVVDSTTLGGIGTLIQSGSVEAGDVFAKNNGDGTMSYYLYDGQNLYQVNKNATSLGGKVYNVGTSNEVNADNTNSSGLPNDFVKENIMEGREVGVTIDELGASTWGEGSGSEDRIDGVDTMGGAPEAFKYLQELYSRNAIPNDTIIGIQGSAWGKSWTAYVYYKDGKFYRLDSANADIYKNQDNYFGTFKGSTWQTREEGAFEMNKKQEETVIRNIKEEYGFNADNVVSPSSFRGLIPKDALDKMNNGTLENGYTFKSGQHTYIYFNGLWFSD